MNEIAREELRKLFKEKNNKNIGWGISNYSGLPNRKKKLLTKEFLMDFKNEIIRLDKISNQNRGLGVFEPFDYEKETYLTFYSQIESTVLFYNALENTCKKHNLIKAIYEYAKNMEWYDSDYFDDDLVLEMVYKDVIEYGSNNYEEDDFIYDSYSSNCKLIKKCKGYNVIKYDRWFSHRKQELEDIYKDSEWKVVWLDQQK